MIVKIKTGFMCTNHKQNIGTYVMHSKMVTYIMVQLVYYYNRYLIDNITNYSIAT